MTAPRSSRATDHFDGVRFFNRSGANGQPFWRVPQMLLTPHTPWPREVAVQQRRPPKPDGDDVIVTFIGHASFLIQTAAGNLLIDPMYSERASPLQSAGPRRARRPGIAFGDLPPIAAVLVSHNHYDHLDLRTLEAVRTRFAPQFVAPLGNGRILASAGVQSVHELDWWEQTTVGDIVISMTESQHFSARTPFDRNRALWGGFAISAAGRTIYFAGDSGFGPHVQRLRGLGPIDVALLPIGAYEPRWFMKDVHMSPKEAVSAHLAVGAVRSIAMHYGTFQLTPEGIDDPVVALAEARRAAGVPEEAFRTLDVGESLVL
jgi:L-ascorbate metabolism protein UlaG (beta-lactamase superfamily)